VLASTFSLAHGVTPIEKVLQMMGEMKAKGEAEKQYEAVKFSAFDQWCQGVIRVKTNEITTGTTKMEELSAEMEQCSVNIRSLTARIEELDEDVGRWAKDQEAASAVRGKEQADFKMTVSDYAESLSALAGAIDVLKKREADVPQAALVQSLVQVSRLSMIPLSTKKALAAFLQQPVADSIPDAMPDDRLSIAAPEANAYEFQSGGVVDMLVKLEDQFETKKTELEEEELKANHAFTQIMQQLADNIENANHEINKKTTLRSETEQQKAEAQGNKALAQADRSEDMAYKADTEALCNQKNLRLQCPTEA